MSTLLAAGFVDLNMALSKAAAVWFSDEWLAVNISTEEFETVQREHHLWAERRQRAKRNGDKLPEEQDPLLQVQKRNVERQKVRLAPWPRLLEALRRGHCRAFGVTQDRQIAPVDPSEWCHVDGLPTAVLVQISKGETFVQAMPVFRESDLAAFLRDEFRNISDRSTAAAETKCQQWLSQSMRASMDFRPKPKAKFFAEAKSQFHVAERAFDRAWANAVKETGSAWDKAGRQRKGARKSPHLISAPT